MLFWLGVGLMLLPPTALVCLVVGIHFYICHNYLGFILRIFQEKPLFIIPRGKPLPQAELVRFPTTDGLTLRGCYLKCVDRRRGVILFGLEFGSDCWSCWAYVEHLVAAGYDVFAFEPRNQHGSDSLKSYEPLQWLTKYEVEDTQAAVNYLRARPDADPRGIGFFGVSKGGNAGLYVASQDPYIRCCVTDGAFGTELVLVPYMRHYFPIYNQRSRLQGLMPPLYYRYIGRLGLGIIERERGCQYCFVEHQLRKLSPRPLLMIHGESDTYIKPDMARMLFDRAAEPREFWLVPNAKHNQALHLVGAEYRLRVLRFFDTHLASGSRSPVLPEPGVNGHVDADGRMSTEDRAILAGQHSATTAETPAAPTDCI